jgi:hypothetical protein
MTHDVLGTTLAVPGVLETRMHPHHLYTLMPFTVALASLVGCAPPPDTEEDVAVSQQAVEGTGCTFKHCIRETVDLTKPLEASANLNVNGTLLPSKLVWEPSTVTDEGSSYRYSGTVTVGGPATAIPALTFNVEAVANPGGQVSVWGTDGSFYGLASPGPDMQSFEPDSLVAIFGTDGQTYDEADTWLIDMQIELTGQATSDGFVATGHLNFFDEPILFLDGDATIGFDEPILFFDPMTFESPSTGGSTDGL